ncbi:MAG TPA: hypothetical protein VF519_14860 [Mycobacteriales bacterium]
MRRSLNLTRESLTELTTAELDAVAGGEALPTGETRCPTLPLDCVRDLTAQLLNDTVTCIPKTLLCR